MFDKMTRIGNSDKPVAYGTDDKLDDKLGVLHYAEGLARFILQCDTPMAVGIQGEWGSGKTSLMHMVRRILERQKPEGFDLYTYTFETWQFGALDDDSALGLQLLVNVVERIAQENKDSGNTIKALQYIRGVAARSVTAKAVVAGSVNKLSGGIMDGQTFANGMWDGLGGGAAVNDIQERFRELVLELVTTARSKGKDQITGRVIVFIDDLDRIRPERAVEMLEVLKNFMDVEHCVFVIACDYEVVRQGVRAKFGIEDEDKIRAFFDKIIQVPFQMPVESYRLNGLMRDFLESRFKTGSLGATGARDAANDLSERLAPMIHLSTGTNPRAFKRFLNTLDLHSCVQMSMVAASKKKAHGPWDSKPEVFCRAALAALQNGWPVVADYLTHTVVEEVDDSALNELIGGMSSLTQEETFVDADLRSILDREYGAGDAAWRDHHRVANLSAFMDALYKGIDTNVSGVLDRDELSHLRVAAAQMSLTSLANTRSASGWQGFRRDVRQHVSSLGKPVAVADSYLWLLGELWKLRHRHDHMRVVRNSVYFSMEFTCAGSARTLLSINNKGSMRMSIRREWVLKYNMPMKFVKLGQQFVDRCTEAGIVWVETGRQSYTLDFIADPELNHRVLRDHLVRLLEHAESFIVDYEHELEIKQQRVLDEALDGEGEPDIQVGDPTPPARSESAEDARGSEDVV